MKKNRFKQYYYIKHKYLNKGLKGEYPLDFNELTKHKGSRKDRK